VPQASLRCLSGHRARARGEVMTSPAELGTSQQYMQIARRWFTVAGPVGRIRDRLTAFPDLTTSIEDIFVSDDKLAVTLMWRGTHTGPYGGVAATGKPVEVRDTAIWHFRDGKVVEILTLQDQFAILKQIGYLPESVHAA
jgi:predicted ester cyclase